MESFSQDPTEAEFVNNPYPFYHRTRAQGPLFLWREYGLPCATDHALVNSLLRDRRLGREVPPERRAPVPDHLRPFMDFESRSMLELEAPTHTRLRGLVVRAFTSRRINALAPDIAALAHQLIDAFPAGPFDLLTAFAEKIPVIIIARLLGVPEDMSDQLLEWSHDMVAMYQANRNRDTETRAVAATVAFSEFMAGYIEQRRKAPRDDLLSALIRAEEEGEKLSRDELITTAILLLNAGHEATVHAIGNGVKCLLELDRPAAPLLSAENVAATAEELLRLDPPLHMFTRQVYEDIEIEGHKFARGDEIALLLGAANRDPAAYDDPDSFDPRRDGPANLAFGAGAHFCIGAPLARLEMTIALPILFARLPHLKLAAQPQYADRYHFHGLTCLMVSA